MEVVSVARIKVKKVSANELLEADDELAIEEPLEIQLLYGSESGDIQKSISVTMRTPGSDEELAVGFLFTEGIIQNRKQVSGVKPVPFDDNKVLVSLCENEQPMLQTTER